MIDVAECPICAKRTDTILTRVLRRGQGIVFHCSHCDLGFLVSEPRDQKAYYAEKYREHVSHRADDAATTPQEIFNVYSQYQAERVKLVMTRFRRGDSILEIGASAGQFLYHLHGMGRRCAVELDTACCGFMAKMGIETSSSLLWESRFFGDEFDVVCAFQVMEHVEDPVQFIRGVRDAMKPGAMAFIEVPNLREPLLSVWDIPEYVPFYFHADHLWYFTEKSLKDVAVRAGFKDPEVKFTQDYNLLSHIHWLMNKTPQPTCEVGLGPVKFKGKDTGMAGWLSGKLRALNEEYISMLESSGQTSNLMLILTAD